jgi:hypothetical protein
MASTGCTPAPVDTVGELPTGFYGTYQDNGVGAINQSAWALASPRRTIGNPLEALKAVIAVEWLADELEANPRWITLSPLAKWDMQRARADVRRTLGIKADTPSSSVLAALLKTTRALQSGVAPGAVEALRTQPFTLPAGQTFDILTNLPYVASANIATSEVASEILTRGSRI